MAVADESFRFASPTFFFSEQSNGRWRWWWQGEEGSRRPEGWWPQEKARLPLRQGRPPVPRWPDRAIPQEGPLCSARRYRCSRLPCRRPGVPSCRGNPLPFPHSIPLIPPRALLDLAYRCGSAGAGVGWERGARQQEEPDHSQARAAGHKERRGAGEAACGGDHRARRRAPQHQPGVTAEEEQQCRQGAQVAVEGHQIAQESLGSDALDAFAFLFRSYFCI